MIVVKVELWPHGDAEKAEPLGVLAIRNTGDHAGGTGVDPDHYYYELSFQDGKATRPFYARIMHYRRRGWKVLVRRAVEELMH